MADIRWSLCTREGLTVVRAAVLAEIDGVAHGFSTRCGNGDEFDLGPAAATGEPWNIRRARLANAVGLDGQTLLAPRQVHGDRVVSAAEFAAGATPAADAVAVGAVRGAAPAVRTADCLPILIAARDGRAVAAVHAGWRGTAASVVRAAVARLADLGVAPGELAAALGPAIGPCCYEVGTEVVDAVIATTGGDPTAVSVPGPGPGPGARPHLDLVAANRLQLQQAGLDPGFIEASPWCTRCQADLFWSWRRDGESAGRMMACIGWTAGAA